MSERHTGDLAEWIQEDGPAVGRPGQHPVAVLSAAMLRTARARCQESLAEFAARAGVALDVVQGAEDGTCPTWALSYADFTALADAVAAWWPRPAFETAAGCDLLLSCILNGDQVLATDVLAEDGTRELARSLLRWAVTGDVQARGRRRARVGVGRLLGDVQLGLLRDRLAGLAVSGSVDAWVGAELLLLLCGAS
jgi:hypothetical protein